jgi:hypothetical protein
MPKRFHLAISFAAVLAVTIGCAPDNTSTQSPSPSETRDQQFTNWPHLLNEFRFHWTADPDIDIAAGVAVPIRAYLESYYVASFTANLDNAYRGFMRATPQNDELDGHYLAQLAWIRPLHGAEAKPEEGREHFGYISFHLLSVDRAGDAFRAIVCQGNYGDFIKSDAQPRKFVSLAVDPKTAKIDGLDNAVVVHRIELTQNDPRVGPNPPASVTSPQRGPAPAPDQDVFGNWFFTGSSSSFWGPIDAPDPENVATPELERQCSERLPFTETERTAMMTGFKDRPPAHGQAQPGWPFKPN